MTWIGPLFFLHIMAHMCAWVCVCLSVCVFTFEVPFKHLFPPLPEVGCPKFLELLNPWGKVMERSSLRIENLKIVFGLIMPH